MKKIAFAALVVLMALTCGAAQAQNGALFDSASCKVWVLAIGVGKYQRPEFQALAYANDGARKFAGAILDARPQSTTATILTSDSSDTNLVPTRTNVLRAINEFARKVSENDLVIVYFCGHGIDQGGQQHLLLMDADLSDKDTTESSTILLSSMREKLEALACPGRLIFLDACRENPRRSGGVFDSNPMSKNFLKDGGSWNPAQGKVSATFFGCREGEKVYYGKSGQSFFTEALVDGLNGKATDESGSVTLKSLSAYVQDRVPKAINDELGPSMQQKPILMSAGATPVILRPTAGYIAIPRFVGEFGDLYAEKVQTLLTKCGQLNLVERNLLAAALKELNFQDSGITDPTDAAKLGKQTNAKFVILGSAQATPDGNIHVSVRLVEVATGRNFPGIAADATFNKADWDSAIASMADELYQTMVGTSIVAKPSTICPPKETPKKPAVTKPQQPKPVAPKPAAPKAPSKPKGTNKQPEFL